MEAMSQSQNIRISLGENKMNKILRTLLVFALVGGTMMASSDKNKTHDKTRPQAVNLAMEYTTWNELLQTKDEDRFGAHFQVTPFYQDSNEGDELGEYFGAFGKHEFYLKNNADLSKPEVPLSLILHDYQYAITGHSTAAAEIEYKPSQQVWGVRIDYYQCLGKILKGLYLKAVLPVVNVENKMGLEVEHVTTGGVLTSKDVMYNYFNGKYSAAASTGNGQAELHDAKIHGEHNTTQVADIDVVLGWKFLDKEKYHLSINLGLTIPTSNESEGNWVFEPQAGNGNHWGFGAGFDGRVNLWTKKSQNIKLESALNYRYLFSQDEERTLRFKELTNYGTTDKLHSEYSQYFLIAKDGDTVTTPAANILTRNVDVTPGSQLDAIIQLAYNNGGFNAEIGYNLFWKDEEEVNKPHWKEEYYIAGPFWNTSAHVFGHVADAQSNIIKKENLNIEAAETPSQLTNKIYGGLGYIFKKWEYPLMLGLGAHYEFADKEEGGIENWGIWGKIGVAF
jgi:hypothetical protein